MFAEVRMSLACPRALLHLGTTQAHALASAYIAMVRMSLKFTVPQIAMCISQQCPMGQGLSTPCCEPASIMLASEAPNSLYESLSLSHGARCHVWPRCRRHTLHIPPIVWPFSCVTSGLLQSCTPALFCGALSCQSRAPQRFIQKYSGSNPMRHGKPEASWEGPLLHRRI